MKFKITYENEAEPVEVLAIPLARRQLEEEHKRPLLELMGEGFGAWAEELVHRTLVIRAGESRSLEEWLRTVDAIELQVAADDDTGEG